MSKISRQSRGLGFVSSTCKWPPQMFLFFSGIHFWVKHLLLNCCSVRICPPALPGGHRGSPKPEGRHNFSSVFWISWHLLLVGYGRKTSPQGDIQEASHVEHWKLAPLDVDKLPWDVYSSLSLRLISANLQTHSFIYRPQFMNISEGWNGDEDLAHSLSFFSAEIIYGNTYLRCT